MSVAAGSSTNVTAELRGALVNAVRQANTPGAVAYVGDLENTYLHEAAGERRRVPHSLPAQKDTIYDLASLTKVIATTTAFMLQVEEGKAGLDQPVGAVVPVPAFNRFTFRQLLTHTSGLQAWKPWFRDASSVTEMLQRAATLDLAWPPGTRRQYSDIGFIILGRAVELLAGDSLDAVCRARLWQPLGMARTDFRPPPAWRDQCAPTEQCAWRNRIVHGEVQDENAFAAGGVAGHAGLFSTAGDLATFCRACLAGRVLKPATLDAMCRLDQVRDYPWQGMGWRLNPFSDSVEGFLPSRAAIGHTGWTGTSLWLDRDTGLFAILLSNTCHPSRTGRRHTVFRTTFYGAVARRFYTRTANTHTGLDRVANDLFRPLAGRRVALLTHHAALNELGSPVLDVLRRQPEVMLRRLYSPEHGLFGQAEAGARVGEQAGAPVPVTSLYGGRAQPSREELREVDVFVIDLQDVGARYYTYAHTMKQCLAACAAANVPVIVLDRPNPVGGAVLEGPMPERTDSPVCWGRVPIRHGMTLGETALFFQKTDPALRRLGLEVKTLDSWPRAFHYHQCALPWLPPSPNIPTPDTALVYVGACLFEGTNLNEGRGTDSPFQLVGAPWLDPARVLAAMEPGAAAGCALWPTFYTPRSIPGKAANPRFQGQFCRGIRIAVTDHPKVRAFTLAVALIRAMREIHPDHFAWDPMFDTLAGGPGLRRQIEAGKTAAAIAAEAAPALEAFDRTRPRLYA